MGNNLTNVRYPGSPAIVCSVSVHATYLPLINHKAGQGEQNGSKAGNGNKKTDQGKGDTRR
jgi:hypothetical protein